MDVSLFSSFLVATMVIVVTPGSTVALASSKAVKFGPQAAFVTVLGDALGTATQIVVAVLGLQVLISVAEDVLPFMQILGGLYIMYLGYQSFVEPGLATDQETEIIVRPREATGHFWAGFLVCVSNPKSIIFFIALFPGFISQKISVVFQSFVYGAVFVLLDAMFIMGYSVLAIKAFNSSIGSSLSVSKVSGMGLMLVGALLCWNGSTLALKL
ncbi:LysE family translocator [Roseibium algae]|uniref:LysE family translocator n=1 Tax=Roseibium algae TaxID=3123038 RepID=A0ABU8TIR1_9HYPH